MKSFASKKSLESTFYATLKDLVEEVVKFTLENPRPTYVPSNGTDAEKAEEYAQIAERFCQAEDRQYKPKP
jgi:hypothetical protein